MDKENIDAVLGSRFLENSKVHDYPLNKLILNRLFNFFRVLFFGINIMIILMLKIYKRDVLVTLMPFVSESFNIFLEIPLKLISRKYSYKVIGINWFGRKKGKAKFKINELDQNIYSHYYIVFSKNSLNIRK